MNKCPITYEACGEDEYSRRGLRYVSPQLKHLHPLTYSAQEQRQEAAARAGKMSIQGVQPKLSARLKIREGRFELVEMGGNYILKPPSEIYPQLPENEALTMKLALQVGIEVPVHGLVYAKDGSMTYFIKRFDRYGRGQKYAVEDFAQLTGNTRETKYNWSMEKLVPVIEQYCTFPVLEKSKLLHRVIFCFLTGNEDMHLKNFSLITRQDIISLAPAYDLLNSTLALGKAVEELALPLNGKKSKFKPSDFVEYYGRERLRLTADSISSSLNRFPKNQDEIRNLIRRSFLDQELQEAYLEIFQSRMQRLGLA